MKTAIFDPTEAQEIAQRYGLELTIEAGIDTDGTDATTYDIVLGFDFASIRDARIEVSLHHVVEEPEWRVDLLLHSGWTLTAEQTRDVAAVLYRAAELASVLNAVMPAHLLA